METGPILVAIGYVVGNTNMNIRSREASRPTVVAFDKLPIGSIFRALRDDIVRGVVVKNSGLYAKVGHAVSIDLGHQNKDCIFSLKMPCRVFTNINHIDVTELEAYKVCHAGAGA